MLGRLKKTLLPGRGADDEGGLVAKEKELEERFEEELGWGGRHASKGALSMGTKVIKGDS